MKHERKCVQVSIQSASPSTGTSRDAFWNRSQFSLRLRKCHVVSCREFRDRAYGTEGKEESESLCHSNEILDGTRCKGLGRSCALGTIVTGSRENRDVKTVIEKYVRP
jgi:hypothetical protein